jgi:hypothetical protein
VGSDGTFDLGDLGACAACGAGALVAWQAVFSAEPTAEV